MKIAMTGATGFLGRYIVSQLAGAGNHLTCWHRPDQRPEPIPRTLASGLGQLDRGQDRRSRSEQRLLEGADAVVHAALDHPGGGFRGNEGDFLGFIQANLVGTLRLIEAAQSAGIGRFIFISSCAVHDRILPDRPLDETHPTWSASHYGAHKAAIEAFVHSFGFGQGFPICACGRRESTAWLTLLRPASGIAWSRASRAGSPVECRRGGKEVHAADVARAVDLLLRADPRRSPARRSTATTATSRNMKSRRSPGGSRQSDAEIRGEATSPKNQIVTAKLDALGMTYGGVPCSSGRSAR